jgi:sugar lactone lactonase YvrE
MGNKANKNKMFISVWGCVLLMFFTLTPHLFPVEVKKIDIHRFEDFQQGEFRGTSLDGKGRLFIGPRINVVPGPVREYYLALDKAPNGDIYVGTGHQAALYRVISIPAPTAAPDAQEEGNTGTTGTASAVQQVFSTDALDIFAVLVKKNGDVFAGTSPEGKIYRIPAAAVTKNKNNQEKKEFFNPDEKFIWDLKEDKDGNIICAVGSSGGVYRIDPTGQAVKIFTPEDTHIVSLYITRSNSILAGSGDRGILYRIDDRKVKVLFDSPFEEIRGICEDKSGNIYFSATKGISKEDIMDNAAVSKFLEKKKKGKETKIVEKSMLYCLYTNGTVEMPWKSRTEYIYSIYYDEKSDSAVIGTGDSGRVYRVKKDGSFSIIYESDSAQVFKIAGNSNNKGFTLITNNTASIVSIEDSLSDKGTYYSEVYDLQIQSKLGRIYREAQTPGQTEVLLFIRTGNSNVPDKTWSQWSPPFTDSENSTINISGCRYFQVKAVLNSKNAAETPYLDRFKVFYIQSNIGPQLKKIEIKKPTPIPARVSTGIKTKPVPKKPVGSNYLIAGWRAADRNKDKLKYNIYIKKYSARNWILVKEDMTGSELKLNTDLYQDGKYLLRVVVDDSLSNPPAMAKSQALVSAPFLIDSTAPVIGNFSAAGTRLRFNVVDQTSLIADVLYSFDGKIWYPVFPVDMINDSKSETFDVDLKDLGSRNFIFLKALDEFGNCSVFQEEL